MPETKGAFCFDLSTMAIDRATKALLNETANAIVFGQHHIEQGRCFPQVKYVYLR